MKLIALMPIRNEDWILGLSLRAALMWADEVVALNHASTDRTVDILEEIQREYGSRLQIISVPERQWDEMQHRQMMLERARSRRATHIAIVDADEILTGNLLRPDQDDRLTFHISPNECMCLLPGYNLRGSLNRYHSSGIWGDRWFSFAFADDPRLSWSGDKFHSREPEGSTFIPYKPVAQGEGGVMHLWGASERRLRAKHSLYKITERLRWPDKPVAGIDTMYSWAIHGRPPFDTPATWKFSDVPESWWAPYAHLMRHLNLDAEPWQEKECARLIQEHGREAFAGLDLFDVV